MSQRIPRIILPQRTILYRAAALPWTGNEARRVDHRRAHLKVPLAPARGSVLILGWECGEGAVSIPLRGTSGHTRHTKNQTPPGADTDRCSGCLRATLSGDIILRDDNIPQLCRSWDNNITDLVSGIPLKFSPIQEVNHKINLIDPEKRIHYCLLKCPEHFREELSQKIERYTTAQWWIPAVAHQAVPMLHILKKNGKLRTVFNLQEQNDNTVKDVTLFPDQGIIRNNMARVAYHSKLNMSEAYKQIHIVLEHVHKTAFASVLGMFRSQVMQMGDCNAPSMFQRLMMAIFWDCISWFVHVYLDNIFIYSCSIGEHEKHLGIVFQWLRDNHRFLSKSKVDLYSKRLECLGHIIDDQGIHADADKMQCIHEWRRPRIFNDVQCFLGLVQYLAHLMTCKI